MSTHDWPLFSSSITIPPSFPANTPNGQITNGLAIAAPKLLARSVASAAIRIFGPARKPQGSLAAHLPPGRATPQGGVQRRDTTEELIAAQLWILSRSLVAASPTAEQSVLPLPWKEVSAEADNAVAYATKYRSKCFWRGVKADKSE